MSEQLRIAVIPGDGIGPEVTDAARQVLEAAGFDAEWLILPDIGGCGTTESFTQAILKNL